MLVDKTNLLKLLTYLILSNMNNQALTKQTILHILRNMYQKFLNIYKTVILQELINSRKEQNNSLDGFWKTSMNSHCNKIINFSYTPASYDCDGIIVLSYFK